MVEHNPMDRLHAHLDRLVQHGAKVHAEATDAATANDAQLAAERQNSVNDGLTQNGG